MRLQLALGLGLGGRGWGANYSSEALAYFAVLDAISPISAEAKAAIDKFVIAIKDAGIWDKADKIGLLANQSISHAAVNLKYPTKTTDADGLGTLNYINGNPTMGITLGQNSGLIKNETTNIIISSRYAPDGTYNYKTTEATIAMWVMELGDNGSYACSDNNTSLYLRPNTSIMQTIHKINGQAGILSMTPEAGFHLATTTSGATKTMYNINGTDGVLSASQGNALPGGEIILGSTPAGLKPLLKPLAFYFIGGALTVGIGGQTGILYNAVRQYLIDIGVIV